MHRCGPGCHRGWERGTLGTAPGDSWGAVRAVDQSTWASEHRVLWHGKRGEHRAATTSLLREPQGTPLWDPGVPAVPGGRCHLAGWHRGPWFHVAPLDCRGEVSQSSSSSVPSSTVSRGSPVAWHPVGARGQPRSGRTCRVQVEVCQAGGCFPGLPRCAALARLRVVLQELWGRHRVRAPGTGSPPSPGPSPSPGHRCHAASDIPGRARGSCRARGRVWWWWSRGCQPENVPCQLPAAPGETRQGGRGAAARSAPSNQTGTQQEIGLQIPQGRLSRASQVLHGSSRHRGGLAARPSSPKEFTPGHWGFLGAALPRSWVW